MSQRRSGVQHRLARVYLVQVGLISLATLLGVLVTALITERVLVEQALKLEAEHFWERFEQDPDVARPDTRHLLGYLRGPDHDDTLPEEYEALTPGFHRLEISDAEPLVYVEDRGEHRLYLEFDEERVFALALVFGIAPLSAVLLLIYLLTYLGWRKSRQLVSPLVRLADALRDTRYGERPELAGIGAERDSEVAVLASALETYADRLLEFVERERQFTRDASHELRTPLAVIRANLQLLEGRFGESRPLRRMEDTVDDMESVIEALLLLARNEARELPEEEVVVNDLAMNLVERLEPLAKRKGVALHCRQENIVQVRAPEALLGIVLTNLVRNGINYTDSGTVEVTVGPRSVMVSDTGPGMDAEALRRFMQPFERGTEGEGHGLGLAIVQRLCERCGWKLEVASGPQQGTRVRVTFPYWQLPAARVPTL